VSGIVGVYYLDGRPVRHTDLERMNQILAHRGPDGAGLWSEVSVGLAHRLLWTTPESLHERLPMVSTHGDIVLTADARIDNRDELIAALSLKNGSIEEISDSALILAAYEKWGDRCPERLLGDFAFVVWDRRRHGLFCARDHFGVRPFYYYHNPGKIFAFASEIKALLCLTEVPRLLNEQRLGDYLEGIFEDKRSTFYRDILRLPPAHSATVSAEAVRLHCYWSLDGTSELRLGSNGEYAAAYRETFTEAVRCRLRSAFPVGSHLSGGLDSSSITCVARDLLGTKEDRRLNSYSIIFDEVPESDERPFINAVVEEGGLEPHYVRGDAVTPLTDVERVLWHQDEPFCGPNLFLNWQVWTAAREDGVRVLLDGIMGDNVVSHGFAYLNELARSWRWVKLAREIKALAGRRNTPHWKIVGRYVWNDGIKPKFGVRQFAARIKPHETVNPVTNRDFAQQMGLTEHIKCREEVRQGRLRSVKQDHYQELVSGIIPAALEMVDKGACAFNIELRIPFLDRRLVELCFAMPPEQKIHNGWTRVVARRALVDHLPKKVRSRVDKGDLGVNFIRALISEQSQLRELLFGRPKLVGRFINEDSLRVLYDRLLRKEAVNDDEALMLFSVSTLSLWLRESVIDNDRRL
jgi:asparagine synthase (glutamine-hydrolysing)